MPHVLIKYAHVLICICAGEGSRHFSAFHFIINGITAPQPSLTLTGRLSRICDKLTGRLSRIRDKQKIKIKKTKKKATSDRRIRTGITQTQDERSTD